MHRLSRWLPADTRTVEFTSGAALVVCALAIAAGLLDAPIPTLSWALMLACLGSLQLVGTGFELRALQLPTSLICGTLWVYTGASGVADLQAPDIVAWFVGFGNLYAFVLHATRTVGVLHD